MQSKKGFTLLELLISLAGGILIFLGLLQLFSATRAAYYSIGPRAEAMQNARIALERLSRDLRQTTDMVSIIPETDNDPENPPPSEIEFQDGHNPSSLTYLRYHLQDSLLYREEAYYAFAGDPLARVRFDALNEFAQSPARYSITDEAVAENFSDLQFFGDELISVFITAANGNNPLSLRTTLFARNLVGG